MKNNVKIMCVLNITPDSFYDGRENLTLENNRRAMQKVISADIIDVG